jgi:hypothetical protein
LFVAPLIDCLLGAISVLNDILDIREYLVGVELTVADISVACALQQLFTTTISGVDDYPALKQWLLRMLSEPEFVAVLGQPAPLVASNQSKDGKTKSLGVAELEGMRYPIKIAAFDTALPDLTFAFPIKMRLRKKTNNLGSSFGYPLKL